MKHRAARISGLATATLAFALQAGDARAQEDQSTATTITVPPPAASASVLSSSGWGIDPNMIGLAGGGIYALLSLFCASRRMRGAWEHFASATALSAIMLNPVKMSGDVPPPPTHIIIAVDQSPSQMMDGRDSAARAVIDRLRSQIGALGNTVIHFVNFGDGGRDGTLLFDRLNDALSNIPADQQGGVFVITDGQIADIPESYVNLAPDVPFHVLVTGRDDDRDRRITLDSAPFSGAIGSMQTVKIQITDDGANLAATPVEVIATNNGHEIFRRAVMPGMALSVPVKLANQGQNVLEFHAAPLAGEVTDINNHITTSIRGLRPASNILLISGTLTPHLRLWTETLGANAGVNLAHLAIMRTTEKLDDTPLRDLSLIPLPTHELFSGDLRRYDMIILDQYQDDGLLYPAYLDKIAKYVDDGGALMVVAGAEYNNKGGNLSKTPLSRILPALPLDGADALEQSFVPTLTRAGKKHPVLRDLPGAAADPTIWGPWAAMAATQPVPSAQVVLTGADNSPLMVIDTKGKGRVAMLLSGDGALWDRAYDGGGPYIDLLNNTTEWLMRDPALEAEGLAFIANLQDNTLDLTQQSMGDTPDAVTIKTPSGASINAQFAAVGPGLWRATLPVGEYGVYSAERTGRVNQTAWGRLDHSNMREYTRTVSSTDALAPIAAEHGGRVLRISAPLPEVQFSAPDALSLRKSSASYDSIVRKQPLIPDWLSLFAVMSLLGTAWMRESNVRFRDAFIFKAGPK